MWPFGLLAIRFSLVEGNRFQTFAARLLPALDHREYAEHHWICSRLGHQLSRRVVEGCGAGTSNLIAGGLRAHERGLGSKKRAGQLGSHRFQRPRIATAAGASTPRMMVASSRIPPPRAVAKILASVPGLALKRDEGRPRISAALVTSRPVRPWVQPSSWPGSGSGSSPSEGRLEIPTPR
jgi:hypothetical protein